MDTPLICANPASLPCVWDPDRCGTHRPARLAAWRQVIEARERTPMPAWRQRMQREGLPPKDMTGSVAGR